MKIYAFKKPLSDNLYRFPQITHLQRKYLWDLVLPDLWGLVITGVGIGRLCQDIKFGQYNITDVTERFIGAHKEFAVGGLNVGTMTASFVSPIPDVVTLYMQKWKSLIVSEDHFHNVTSAYKRNVYVLLYDRSGLPVNLIVLKGVFPLTFPEFDLSYGADDIHRFNFEFKYDSMHMGVNALGNLISDAGAAINKVKTFVSKIL